jgi:pyridoxine kinase
VLFGRHPGLGAPGGAAVPQEILEGVIEGVAASGALAHVDAMIAGYFASPDQVAAGARLIDALRAARPSAWIVVDPIMGDEETGLYVREETAEAIAYDLVPRADLLAPNAWELARLSGRPVNDAASALAAARGMERPVLASSVPAAEDIGVLYASADSNLLALHRRAAAAPRGAGDLLTAGFVGHRLSGAPVRDALAAAVSEVALRVAGQAASVRIEAL